VTHVTWEEAAAYGPMGGQRLPTEQEWEKAAPRRGMGAFSRGGDAWDAPQYRHRLVGAKAPEGVGVTPNGAGP